MSTIVNPLEAVYEGTSQLDAWMSPATDWLARARHDDLRAETSAEWNSVTVNLLQIPPLVRRLYRDLWSKMSAGAGLDPDRAGQVLFAFWDKSILALRYARQSFLLLDAPVDDSRRLDDALESLQKERAEAIASWPWMSPDAEAEAIAEFERGDAVPVETILRELQSNAR